MALQGDGFSDVEYLHERFERLHAFAENHDADGVISVTDELLQFAFPPDGSGTFYQIQCWLHRSSALCQREEYDAAVEACENGLRLAVDVVDVARFYGNMGIAYQLRGDLDQAISKFSEAVQHPCDQELSYTHRGNCYCRKGFLPQALRDYAAALRINPRYAPALNHRGKLYLLSGRTDFAIDDFSRAIELAPDYSSAYANRAKAYTEKGFPNRAAADLNKAKSHGHPFDFD